MSASYIEACPITGGRATILREYKGPQSNEMLWAMSRYYPAINLEADHVYSICSGVVVDIGLTDDTLYTVTVQYDQNRSVRYGNIQDVYVNLGNTIRIGDIVGMANKYVIFEYITISEDGSMWPVRIYTETYYKQDPTPLATGEVTLPDTNLTDVEIVSSNNFPPIEMSDAMLDEFTGNLEEPLSDIFGGENT